MKKIIILLSMIILVGCSTLDISNTPTKKVEEFLNKYQILDEEILNELDNVIEEKTKLNDENKEEYRNIIKKQYKDMQYTIKEETIDGDDATVTAQIIVKDFTKIINDAENYKRENMKEFYENNTYNDNLYKKYLLDKLKDAKDRVTYTLEFTLHKQNRKWVLNPITEEIEDKILGIYKY
ncbi:MAG: hypothetical protein ACI31V_00700 [Bacilli bacterium]